MPPVSAGVFPNPYGYFEPETGAFVITDILTPRPWINVLSNDNYGVVLSQAGGGFSWADNCQLFRINRWEQDLVRDEHGRFLYVLDLDRPDQLWSTTFQPTRKHAAFDQVRHATGCTTFHREFNDLKTSHTVFVPADDCAEVWIVEIRNLAPTVRRLRLASYLEWHLGGVGDWHREFHRLFWESQTMGDTLVAWKHPGLTENRREAPEQTPVAFVTWNGLGPVSWVTDKQTWLGRCGSPESPAGLYDVPPASETPRWDDPVAAGVVDVELAPLETLRFVLVIGAAPDIDSGVQMGRKFSIGLADQLLARTMSSWRTLCAEGARPTGDPATDLMISHWLPYQAIAGRLWAKCAYYQQGGAYGFRDQLQDSLMYLDGRPAETLKQLKKHAEAMYEDGGVRHWWHPGTDIFTESRHSDTCLWLAYGVLAYLDATGDYAALDENLNYLNRSTQKAGERGTLWEHCRRGIDRALDRTSPHGLPLIQAGDWNDGLSHVGISGKGESVWMAMFLYDILNRLRPHLLKFESDRLYDQFGGVCLALQQSVERHGWDGDWYIAGTRDDGKPFGSKSCLEGQLFLNPQTWAVISGIASPERQAKAMRVVKDRLVTDFGALLLQPAYSQVDPYIGYISRYAPGLRENGGVYSHASTWAVQAFAMHGDLETAERIYRGMLPPNRAVADAELYAAEPYVMPGNIDGPDSPYAGRAGWTWYTGSAAWMRRVVKWVS